VQRALDVSTDEDVILVAGSLYVAGAARTTLQALAP
jgi:folylpolyglutamate synthase/dihydropteroate synthase